MIFTKMNSYIRVFVKREGIEKYFSHVRFNSLEYTGGRILVSFSWNDNGDVIEGGDKVFLQNGYCTDPSVFDESQTVVVMRVLDAYTADWSTEENERLFVCGGL